MDFFHMKQNVQIFYKTSVLCEILSELVIHNQDVSKCVSIKRIITITTITIHPICSKLLCLKKATLWISK